MGKCGNLRFVKWVREQVLKEYKRPLTLQEALKLKGRLESAGVYDPCINSYSGLKSHMSELGIGFVRDGGMMAVGDVESDPSQSHVSVFDASGDWGEVRVRLHPDVVDAFKAVADAVRAVLEGVSRAKR